MLNMKLAALAWAAEQAGMSYGHFTMNLSAKDKLKIYRQFQSRQDGKKAAGPSAEREAPSRKKALKKKAG